MSMEVKEIKNESIPTKENLSKENIIKENNNEKALVKKEESSLKNRNVNMIDPVLTKTIGILFYIASFIISAAVSSIFIFTIVNV